MNLKEQQYIVTLAGCGKHDPGGQKAEHHTASPIPPIWPGWRTAWAIPCLSGREGAAPNLFGRTLSGEGQKDPGAGEEFQQQREQVPPRLSGPDPGGDPDPPLAPPDPSALKIFRSRFPMWEVVVQEGNQRAMTEMLREDQLDLMLCNLVNQEGELEYEHLCWDPVIFWSRAHIPAAGMPGTGIHFTTLDRFAGV